MDFLYNLSIPSLTAPVQTLTLRQILPRYLQQKSKKIEDILNNKHRTNLTTP